jgi:pimeloyl-ACP methyl ester carboxylesterase
VADQISLSVDAAGQGLLSGLNGQKPVAPAWFEWALAQAPEARMIQVDGCAIETLAWGERGKPGLLLLHGNGAHAHWYSFLAPFFADRFRVATLSWSGMGNSGWRKTYTNAGFVAEALAAAEATGLFEAPVKPIIAAHSFGGYMGLNCAAAFGARLAGLIVMDSPIEPPGMEWDGPPQRSRPNRVYAQFEEALQRFRLAPPQPCETLFAIDHIARHSLKQVEGGWTWKFDPFLWGAYVYEDATELLRAPGCPLALQWGARSNLITPVIRDFMIATAPMDTLLAPVPEADHHLMLDQPLAWVASVNALTSALMRN